MRKIYVEQISELVSELCIKANKILPKSVEEAIVRYKGLESSDLGKEIMGDIEKNFILAKELDLPVCQDTGMAVVFIKLGQQVEICGGLLEDAVNQGVRDGYIKGLLRCSVVSDPLVRKNTNDNTPAVIHIEMTQSDSIEIMVAPKGFGSENMSAVKMFTPSAKKEDIVEFVCETVKNADGNPCPPIIVGVGIGGNFEKCTYLAKKALCRDINIRNDVDLYSDLENQMLEQINKLGIGPQGFGGTTTALGVNIETFPTHIAGLPVAVNIGCHVTRHAKGVI